MEFLKLHILIRDQNLKQHISKILDKHNIQIIFALGHAPFVERFDKTMKNRKMKCMKSKNTDNWSKIMTPVLDAYNNSPHSITKIAPNKVKRQSDSSINEYK